MFDAYCPACRTRRLVFAGQIRGIRNGEAGIRVAYRCWCGADGTWTTGRRSAEDPATSRAPARRVA